MGRPALPLDDQALIFGLLGLRAKGSAEFRKARRDMAARYDRTERAIENVFDRCRDEFLALHGRETVPPPLP